MKHKITYTRKDVFIFDDEDLKLPKDFETFKDYFQCDAEEIISGGGFYEPDSLVSQKIEQDEWTYEVKPYHAKDDSSFEQSKEIFGDLFCQPKT